VRTKLNAFVIPNRRRGEFQIKQLKSVSVTRVIAFRRVGPARLHDWVVRRATGRVCFGGVEGGGDSSRTNLNYYSVRVIHHTPPPHHHIRRTSENKRNYRGMCFIPSRVYQGIRYARDFGRISTRASSISRAADRIRTHR